MLRFSSYHLKFAFFASLGFMTDAVIAKTTIGSTGELLEPKPKSLALESSVKALTEDDVNAGFKDVLGNICLERDALPIVKMEPDPKAPNAAFDIYFKNPKGKGLVHKLYERDYAERRGLKKGTRLCWLAPTEFGD